MGGSWRRWLPGVLALLCYASTANGADPDRLNACLSGRVLDFTHHHGCDHRFWAPSLGVYRDAYVYLPPNYDADQAYPLFVWLHGFGGDERQFTRQVVRALDESIVSGAMPPVVAISPDVSVPGVIKPWCQGSWCINGRQGAWGDFVVNDVMSFVQSRFKIRPEREAHVIAGWSMGGFAAYNLAFKHPDKFRLLVGAYPNLHLRYVGQGNRWRADFDPRTMDWLDGIPIYRVLGLYPRPLRIPVPAPVVFWPAWGRGDEAMRRMSEENPYELLDRLDIRPGQFDMFVAYGRRDEYNVDAQVEAFLHKAAERDISAWVRYNPEGHHRTDYVNECMPDVFVAVGRRLRELLPEESSKHEIRGSKGIQSSKLE